jgi:hypothetical protein
MLENFLNQFRYFKDDPSQLNIDLAEHDPSKTSLKNYENLRDLLASSIKITKEIFPDISDSIEIVLNKLKIKNNFNFFVTANHIDTNASCISSPDLNSAEIILTSKLIELLNYNELKYVIGHEIAHFYFQHHLYPSPSSAKNRISYLNYLNFSRAAEISCDRIGFLASENLDDALRAMLKILTGLNEKHIKFNFSSYLDQLRELKEIKGNSNLINSTHPTLLNRMQALIWFSMSNEYLNFIGSKNKGIYSLKEIDTKIDLSIQKIVGDELIELNKDIFSRSLMWGALGLFLADKNFNKKEQELFEKNFGKKNLDSIKSLIKISSPKSIKDKIHQILNEASVLIKEDKNKLLTELEKISSVASGEKKELEEVFNQFKKLI